MVKYQGSKASYCGNIAKIINSIEPHLDFIDGCCGSGVMTEQMGKSTTMIDKGAWGRFWYNMYLLRDNAVALAKANWFLYQYIGSINYNKWLREAVHSTVTNQPHEFVITFLALQRESFNGVPIAVGPILWKTSGQGITFSFDKVAEGWTRAKRVALLIDCVINDDINNYISSVPTNFYIDPDYQDTAGYYHSADINKIISNNKHCNIFVSHSNKLPGEWDEIHDITREITRRPRTHSVKELLHIKRRT